MLERRAPETVTGLLGAALGNGCGVADTSERRGVVFRQSTAKKEGAFGSPMKGWRRSHMADSEMRDVLTKKPEQKAGAGSPYIQQRQTGAGVVATGGFL